MNKINILWTTSDKDTILNMISMYAINAKTKGWWEHVNVIIWGASANLIAQDSQVQTEVLEMLHHGVTIEACKDCADTFKVSGTLKKLGVNVRYMGEPLTGYIKSGEHVLSL